MLQAQALTRRYADFTAVDDVSFTIGERQVTGLLGHNGAGKTTIMKMMTGFLEPSSGAVLIDGNNIEQQRLHAQARIGYLPENCPVYPDMTVVDFLHFSAQLKNMSKSAAGAAVKSAIKRTDLGLKALQNIQTLSRGYRQRVGVAQALLSEPDILILDEPTNGLDPAQIENMRYLIKELSATASVVISTHILQEVHAVCDQVLILNQGKLAYDAPLSELQQSAHILLTLAQAPQQVLTELQQLPTLQDAQFVGEMDGVYEYRLTPAFQDADSQSDHHAQAAQLVQQYIPNLVRQLVAQQYEIYSVRPQRRDLDSIFRDISYAAQAA